MSEVTLTADDLERMKQNAEMRLSHAMSINSETLMEIERRHLALIALARRALEGVPA